MLRRMFITSTAAATLVACGAPQSRVSSTPAPTSGFELVLIDAQTSFAAAAKPYLAALRDEAPADDAGIDWVTLDDYGRDDGVTVRAPVVAVADRRDTLEAYFSGLPPQWQLPSTHGLRYEQGSWPDGAGPPRWGARVVRLPAVVTADNVVRAEAEDASVWLQLDSEGTEALARTSAANIGQRLAIVVDAEIVARPVINARISGGRVQISVPGGPSASEALAARLATG